MLLPEQEWQIQSAMDELLSKVAENNENMRLLMERGLVHLFEGSLTTEAAMNELKQFETPSTRFAIDQSELMITHGDATGFSRFMFRINEKKELDITTQENLESIEISDDAIPNARSIIKDMHQDKKPVVVFLGATRQADPRTISSLSDQACEKLVENFSYAGVLTAGYRGLHDNVYGITRAAYDAARKTLGKMVTLVIMPEVGKADVHVNPESLDLHGAQWGDDTPALIGASDAAIVFAPYGLISELEIATAIKLNKIIVKVDPTLSTSKKEETTAACGYVYDKPLPTYRTVEDAMADMCDQLHKRGFSPGMQLNHSQYHIKRSEEYEGSPLLFSTTSLKWTNAKNTSLGNLYSSNIYKTPRGEQEQDKGDKNDKKNPAKKPKKME